MRRNRRHTHINMRRIALVVLPLLVSGCQALKDLSNPTEPATSSATASNLRVAPSQGSESEQTRMQVRWDYDISPGQTIQWIAYLNGNQFCYALCNTQGTYHSGTGTINQEFWADDAAAKAGYGTMNLRIRVFNDKDETLGDMTTQITIDP